MPEKTLKIKKVFAWTIYNSLKNTPPKDFPTTGEIKETISGILPAFKAFVSEYLELVVLVEEIHDQFSEKKITEEEKIKKIEEINEKFKVYNKEHAEDVCEIKLSEEVFKVLKTQFDRDNWGKKWVVNLEEFGELMVAFEEAAK
jgi:hypothetical protein